jgi:Ser/Thr protein kinase RdoA (MazF antagonist)
MNDTRPIQHGNSFFSFLPEWRVSNRVKWIGAAALIGGVACAIFQYMRKSEHHKNPHNSGSSMTSGYNPPASVRVVERVELNKNLVESILSELGMELTGDLEIPKEGRIASNVIATTNRGKYVIRLYPKGCQSTKLETGNVDFEVEALCYLAANRISVPSPMVFKNRGKAIFEIDGSKIFVYPLISGRCIQQSELSVGIASRSAQLLSSMIEASTRFEPRVRPLPEGDVGYILQIAEKLTTRFPELRTSNPFNEMVQTVRDSNVEERLVATPRGIVHGDFFFENIIVDGENPLSIIDFGDAYYGAVLMDIVISSMEFSVLSDGSWNLEMFEASLKPHSEWLEENKIDFPLFYDLLMANCLRFAVYTLPNTLRQQEPVAENPYVFRFYSLETETLKIALQGSFNKIMNG